MLYLASQYWIWLAAAAVIGVLTPLLSDKFGWAADLEHYWLARIGVVLAIPLILIAVELISGKPILLFEAAFALVLAYIVGGVAGGAFGRLFPARFEGWWVGLFVTGLIWAVFAITAYPKFEPDLQARVAEAIKGAGADPLDFELAGRDVLLLADATKPEARADLITTIKSVPGVRRVTDVDALTGAALTARTVAKLTADAEAAKAAAAAKAEAAA
ncbi:MAG: OmpA family protein, partial [Rhodopseudomonas sp.]|nr:OmpA family protein [Rhodopseudomonas sp.]